MRKSMVIGCDDSGGRGSRNSSEEAAVSIATVERLSALYVSSCVEL